MRREWLEREPETGREALGEDWLVLELVSKLCPLDQPAASILLLGIIPLLSLPLRAVFRVPCASQAFAHLRELSPPHEAWLFLPPVLHLRHPLRWGQKEVLEVAVQEQELAG